MACHVMCVNFSMLSTTVMATGDPRLVGRALNSQRLFSWGANSYGQLAAGHCDDTFKPKEIQTEIGNVLKITGGGGHTLIITDCGKLFVCGSNDKGQLGLGTTENTSVLKCVETLQGEIITKAVGGWDFTVVLNDKGDIYTFGSNTFGQLGITDQPGNHVTLPVKLTLPGEQKVIDVAAGLRHVVVLTDTGQIYTWGGRVKGADKTKQKRSQNITPVLVNLPPSDGKVTKVTAGSYHSVALTDCGEIICWGDNKYGQLALSPDTTKHIHDPYIIPVILFDGKVIDVQSGWTHMIAITDKRIVYSWGRADYGQLGREVQSRFDPTPQPIKGLDDVTCKNCGSEHNLALSDKGKIATWGWNEHGLCGNGNEENVLIPTQLTTLSDYVIKLIGSGAGHSFAMVDDT